MIHSYPSLSLWHLANDLQRLGSGQRSKGVCPFLFFIFRSAPLAARKSAMDALLFLSVPCVPKPIRSCRERTQKAINNYKAAHQVQQGLVFLELFTQYVPIQTVLLLSRFDGGGAHIISCSITYPPFGQKLCQKKEFENRFNFFSIFTRTTRKLDDLLLLQLSFRVITEVDLEKGACCRKIVVTFV